MTSAPQSKVNQKADQLPLPTPRDLLLLRACLHPSLSQSSFKQWRGQIDFETEIDRGSFRLLPLLYYRYGPINADSAIMARLKGIYRRSWSKNNWLLFAAIPTLALLQKKGIRLLLLKGLPLAKLYYEKMALRPMADVDLLVQHKDREEAVNLLLNAGYMVKEDASLQYIYKALRSVTLVKDNLEIDLHWSPLLESFGLKKEHLFWSFTQKITLGQFTFETLDTTGHLFHAIVHGFKRNPEPPIRWIADAVYLMKKPENIDWQRLWQLGLEHGVLMQLNQGFTFLKDEFQQPVAEEFIKKLKDFKPNYSQRLLYRYALSDGWQFEAPSTFSETIRMHYFLHLRRSIHQPFILQNITFIGYSISLFANTPLYFIKQFSKLLFKALKAG